MNLDELDQYYSDHQLLKTLTIELLNQCNWNCKHCYLTREKACLPLGKVKQTIDLAKTLGLFEVRLTGGEVGLYEDLHEVIKYTRERHLNVTLLTNLSKINSEVEEAIETYGLNRVEVTVFSLNSIVHDSFVRFEGALERTIRNIRMLRRLGVDVLVKTWAIKSNINELDTMKVFFEDMGCAFQIHTQIYVGLDGTMKLPKQEMLNAEEMIEAIRLSDKSLHRSFPLENLSGDKLCKEFSTSLYITSYGDITPCAKFRRSLGNIYNDNIADVWRGDELRRIKDYCWGDCRECDDCTAKNYCVRCGAMSYLRGNDFLDNCYETCILAKRREGLYGKK